MQRRKRSVSRGKICLGAMSCLVLVGGCLVGPNYKPPQTPMPAGWVGPTPPPATAEDQNLARWWIVFRDPTLIDLVDRSFRSNLDLQLAESQIRQARAARGVAFAGLGPTVDATGSFRRGQSPGLGGTGPGPTTNLFQAGLDAVWEFDLFGGTRRNIEAAEADWQAAIEARRNTLVTLASEVSLDYIQLRTLQQRIVIAQRNLTVQKHSADLTRQRFEGGFVSGLDVANADAQVATTAAVIPSLEAAARQTIYALSLLTGQEPGALVEELTPASDIPLAPPAVPATVPSDLLRRRPDIRQSEAQIHAATARIGVATADLFPIVSLSSATIGFQSSSTGSLFQGNNRFWSLGPSASWTIFDTGRILSNIEVEKALQEQSILAYRQTVLNALGEVENALIASAKEQEHRAQLTLAVTANRKAVDLSTTLYTQGQTDFLSVLDAQRSLYLSEDALVQSTGAVSTDLIALYKALGGGWEAEPPQNQPAGPPNDPPPPNGG